jgi:hypothetical protein
MSIATIAVITLNIVTPFSNDMFISPFGRSFYSTGTCIKAPSGGRRRRAVLLNGLTGQLPRGPATPRASIFYIFSGNSHGAVLGAFLHECVFVGIINN